MEGFERLNLWLWQPLSPPPGRRAPRSLTNKHNKREETASPANASPKLMQKRMSHRQSLADPQTTQSCCIAGGADKSERTPREHRARWHDLPFCTVTSLI